MVKSLIICDTREKLPIPFEKFIKRKLNVGDYSTLALENRFHIERKSGADLYGSIIGKNHERFRNEFIRAQTSQIQIHVMIECSESDFLQKRFRGAERIKGKTEPVLKALQTMSEKYDFSFEFCGDRDTMEQRMQRLFYLAEQKLSIDI
jgi:ERCC4-type nuclease